MIRWAKRIHFEKLFLEAEGSPKKTWTIINIKCLNKSKSQGLPESMKVSDGSIVNGKQKVAEEMNQHFARIGEATVNSNLNDCLDVESGFRDFLPHPLDSSICLSTVTEVELKNLVKIMKNGHYEGTDYSSTYLLKQTIGCYAQVLVHLVNLCFKHGYFSEVMITARVILLHKGGNKQDPSNYRPISILSAFSKVIEKCIYNTSTLYLTKVGSSTLTFVIRLTSYSFKPNSNTLGLG
ncbi:uncharacterized protein LOC136030834 [Artemia franciscana]|uniref:uncharacterized protein LOC136030834 n=1 Tax=Artemia franciscana TaxID=6661 RepID=UPI0032D9CF40